jgi:prepilin-type N-terminal cleavage/methylation domain-containing protein
MNAGRTTRKGFTLIEMLAAMALMVAAASCLYSSLYTAFRARRSAESDPDGLAGNRTGETGSVGRAAADGHSGGGLSRG